MQGLQTLSTEDLEVILRCVSSLAMKDAIFLGELPCYALRESSQESSASTALLGREFSGQASATSSSSCCSKVSEQAVLSTLSSSSYFIILRRFLRSPTSG